MSTLWSLETRSGKSLKAMSGSCVLRGSVDQTLQFAIHTPAYPTSLNQAKPEVGQ